MFSLPECDKNLKLLRRGDNGIQYQIQILRIHMIIYQNTLNVWNLTLILIKRFDF